MGNQSCTLVIRTEKQYYSAGEVCSGRIYVSVNDQNGIVCNTLNLFFSGKELGRVHYTMEEEIRENGNRRTHSRDHYESNEIQLINFDVPVYTPSAGHFNPGQYEFPFQFQVPANIPSSMRCIDGSSHCEVRYELKAYLRKAQSGGINLNPFHSDTISSKSEHMVIVGNDHSRSMLLSRQQRIHFPSETHKINYWCCINKGHMHLSAQMDCGDTLVPNQPYSLSFNLSNQSTTNVKTITMEVVEQVTWKPLYREEKYTKSVVTLSKDGSSYNNQRGEVSSPHNEHVSLSHGQNDSNNFTFSLPVRVRDSYHGRMIVVSHFVRVKVMTGCCITSPETSVDVFVIRPSELFSNSTVNGGTGSGVPLASVVSSSPPIDLPPPTATVLDNTDGVVVDAVTLPSDWSPHTADLVVLPVATVIGVTEVDINVNTQKTNESSHQPSEYAQYPNATAPPKGSSYT